MAKKKVAKKPASKKQASKKAAPKKAAPKKVAAKKAPARKAAVSLSFAPPKPQGGVLPMIAGNWKMNGLNGPALNELKAMVKLVAAARGLPEIVVCPPATLIAPVASALKSMKAERRIVVGGQDCHVKASGAHTGDISAAMLKDAGAAYVIVGHSERRADHGEDSDLVAAKAKAAYGAGLAAIICVGETLDERDAGWTLDVVGRQLAHSVPDEAHAGNTVVAYEPVWAIGTGRTPTPEDVATVHAHIRAELAKRFQDAADFRLLYGGSVKPSNAAELMAVKNVDGALVGGASLTAADFWPIIKAKLA